MPKKQGFYSTGIPGKKGTNPFGTVELGSAQVPTVPTPTGEIHGLGPHPKPFRKTFVKGAHGYGHLAKHREGHLRVSGSESAHRLGAGKAQKPSLKTPKTT
jgi:hypothetical protein